MRLQRYKCIEIYIPCSNLMLHISKDLIISLRDKMTKVLCRLVYLAKTLLKHEIWRAYNQN